MPRRSATDRAINVLARYDTRPHYRSSRELAAAAVALANALHDVLYVTGDLIVPHDMATPRRPKFINGEIVPRGTHVEPVHTHACVGCQASLDCDRTTGRCTFGQRVRPACATCATTSLARRRVRVLARTK